MSLREAIEIKKDGGAHANGHGVFTESCLPTTENYISNETLPDNRTSVIIKLETQDGGQKSSVAETEESISENLPFLPELGTDCLDSYDSAVVENNTEWLKARCKGFGQIEFDITPNSTGDDTLDFPGITLDSKGVVSESLTTAAATVVESSDGKIIIKNVPQGAQYATPYLTLSGTNIEDNDTVWQSNNSILPLHTSSDASKTEHVVESNELSLNLGDIDMNLLRSNLSIKDGVLTLFSSEAGEVLTESQSNGDPSVVIQNVGDNILGTVQDSVSAVGAIVNDTEIATTQQNISDNLSLATISIATDKSSNCTKILVDTSVGRQLYQLNTSDLRKLENGVDANGDEKVESQPVALNMPSECFLTVDIKLLLGFNTLLSRWY